MYRILELNPQLKPFVGDIDLRMNCYKSTKNRLLSKGGTLNEFANAHDYFGIHHVNGGWIYREWAPNADKLYLNVKKMMVYMMEATKEMCTRIDHMENLQGRSFADDILPGYQSEEELEALEEQRQKEQRKS